MITNDQRFQLTGELLIGVIFLISGSPDFRIRAGADEAGKSIWFPELLTSQLKDQPLIGYKKDMIKQMWYQKMIQITKMKLEIRFRMSFGTVLLLTIIPK